MTSINSKRFLLDEAGNTDEIDALVEVEVDDYEQVDLHISPRTDDVVTVALSAEEAWRLSRQLARAAASIEIETEARVS